MFKLLLLSAGILGLLVAGMTVTIWAKKDGEFVGGSCASKNKRLGDKGITCSCGGHGACHNEGNHDHDHDHTQEPDKLGQRIFVKSIKR